MTNVRQLLTSRDAKKQMSRCPIMERSVLSLVILTAAASGCASSPSTTRVIFLDGAGHFGAASSIKKGLGQAGYAGAFEPFVWSSFLLWGADHLVAARSGGSASRLADKIEQLRHAEPDGYIALMGLSAGCNVAISALERLPAGVQVDYAVLFQPSVSSRRSLAPALRHVRHRFYVTCSRRDALLASLLLTADGKADTPAGRSGFQLPRGLSGPDYAQYAKVVHVWWRPEYRRYGWNGGHVSSTSSGFVAHVIAPRIRARSRHDAERRWDRPGRFRTASGG